jgi:GNAT superfamily N-acetyltransferase
METTYRVIDALDEHHVPQLMDLYRAEWWTRTRTLEQVRDILKWSDLVIGLCSEPGERLVAFARVLTDRTFKALIFDVIVAADHRGRGIGHRLVEAVLANPVLKQVEHIELYCRPELVTFYEEFGFRSPDSGVLLMRRLAAGQR